jgi:hypothetical protein
VCLQVCTAFSCGLTRQLSDVFKCRHEQQVTDFVGDR